MTGNGHIRIRGLEANRNAAVLLLECQTALIDLERAIYRGLAQEVATRGIVPRIDRLASAARRMGIPVIHATIELLPGARGLGVHCALQAAMRQCVGLHRGDPGTRIAPGIHVDQSDLVVSRSHGLTAFHDSGLASLIRGLNVDTIILAGVSTNIGVPGTAIEAVNHGWSVVVAEDATAGSSPTAHAHAMAEILPMLANIASVDEVISALGAKEA